MASIESKAVKATKLLEEMTYTEIKEDEEAKRKFE